MLELKQYILDLGADLVGFADLSSIASEKRSDLPYGISVGIALKPNIVKLIPSKASIEYCNEYDDLNRKLDAICINICNYLKSAKYNAVAQTIDFVQTQQDNSKTENSPGRATIPHKTVAALAGLGWISKSSLLITPQYGSALRLTSVLTDAPIDVKKISYTCKCGNCRICVDACPGEAIKNVTWSIDTDRDDLIDFYACRKTSRLRGEEINRNRGTCGVCIAVCPHTKKPAIRI